MKLNLMPLKGFRDRYPKDKALQTYIFQKAREVAYLFGFEEYDGPLLEPISLYLNKSSSELVEEQSFKVKDRKNNVYLMRPEMTPSLARMIAAKYQQMTFPVRYFNCGLRYRYEAPQKGRDREFYQMDFDIIGSNTLNSDIELLSVIVTFLTSLGANKDQFKLYINSREILTKYLNDLTINQKLIPSIIKIIDKKDKINTDSFIKMLQDIELDSSTITSLLNLDKNNKNYCMFFDKILSEIEIAGLTEYVLVDPMVVRGLDYYTGLVFEVKSDKLSRTIFGGGRYDNLISSTSGGIQIPGIGFAVSDTILLSFLSEYNLLPTSYRYPSQVLICLLEKKGLNLAYTLLRDLRASFISCEMYPDETAKLDKQLKYADAKNIPLVLIIGEQEIASNTISLKNMKDRTQNKIKLETIVSTIIKLLP